MDEEDKRAVTQPKNDFWKNPKPTNENPNFVRDYFASSRLHFIGSFRARYESMMAAVGKKLGVNPAELLQSSAEKGLLASKRKPAERIVVHVDMDCFFASVAVKKDPSLAGKCIAVCHGGGEISSCSYEARKFGVHAGMFFRDARKMCPDLLSVPYDFSLYEKVSIQIYSRFYDYPGVCVEAVSVDEAYLDLTLAVGDDREGSQSGAEALTQNLRSSIFTETGCTASAGIGPSKLIARLATKAAKPNGQLRVRQENIIEYLDTLKVRDLPGIGWRTTRRLADMGVQTCPQLRALSLSTLQTDFGERQGQVFHDIARALDLRPVQPLRPRKSIGAEASWGVRFKREEGEKARKFITDMADEVASRVVAAGAHGTKVTYKVYRKKPNSSMVGYKHLGHGPCTVLTRSAKLSTRNTNYPLQNSLREVCLRLHDDLGVRNEDLRGVGLQVTDLSFADLNLDYAAAPTTGSTKRIDSFFEAAAATPRANYATVENHSSIPPGDFKDGKERLDFVGDDTTDDIQIQDACSVDNTENDMEDRVELNERIADDGMQKVELDDDRIARGNATLEVPNDWEQDEQQEQIPSQWDSVVFHALPEELQKELLRGRKTRRDTVAAVRDNQDIQENTSGAEKKPARKRKRGSNARRVAFQALAEKKNRTRQSEQVTMTQFADISELREKGHDVLNAEEFRGKPLRECVELLEDLQVKRQKVGTAARHGREREQAQDLPRSNNFRIGLPPGAGRDPRDEQSFDIPSPPSLSSDSDSGHSVAAVVRDGIREGDLVYEDEPLVDYAEDLKCWMLANADDIRSGHVELLRGRVLEFVRRKRLERACSEMGIIRRFAEDDKLTSWRRYYNGIVRDVQTETLRLHGFSLSLQSFDDSKHLDESTSNAERLKRRSGHTLASRL